MLLPSAVFTALVPGLAALGAPHFSVFTGASELAAAISVVASAGVGWMLLSHRRHVAAMVSSQQSLASKLSAAIDDAEGALAAKREAEASSVLAAAEATAKSNFLATMSHEIRTPMNGIIGTAELLVDEVHGEEGQELVKTIRSCGMNLLRVINDILDFSKIEAGKLQLESHDFELRTMLEELADLMAPQAHTKGVEMVCTLDEQLPEMVCGDPGRLRQVLTNLLSNAVKFTRTGEITLAARLEASDEEKVAVCFSIEDTGIGIEQSKLSQVFKSYIQADSSIPRTFGGTGLGLSISSQLVELMGSQLAVESELGRGSRFFFTTPLQIRQSTGPRIAPILSGKRVLYVEDTPTGCERAGALIRELGGDAMLAENAMQALQQALVAPGMGGSIDIIVIDRHLPGLDGFQLARMLKAQPETSGIPLMMTALKTDMPSHDMLDAAGISDVIARPLLRGRFSRAVARVLAAPHSGVPRSAAPHSGVPRSAAPRQKPMSAVEPREQAPAAPRSGRWKSSGTGALGRVLLADDNDFNQTLIQRQLDKLGYDVDVVPHGRAAVEQYFRGRYLLVLMDCQMPEMSGYQAAAEIRRREPDGQRTPIIALTADVLPGARERCLEAGMDDYLSKPVWLQALAETLERWNKSVEKVA